MGNQIVVVGGRTAGTSAAEVIPTEVFDGTSWHDAAGISGVVFQTYPSLKALYAAYTAKVSSLNSGPFKQNYGDCSSQAASGEVGWNHLFQHPAKYTVEEMASGTVKDDQAAGRVFCNNTQGHESMVWTQDAGKMLGYVYGPVQGQRVKLVGARTPQHWPGDRCAAWLAAGD